MKEDKSIHVLITEDGQITAETFNFESTDCLDELNALMKELAVLTKATNKQDFYKPKATKLKGTKLKKCSIMPV
jgi:plasmid maintenance system killer protein